MAQITLGQLLHTNGNEPLGTTNGALNVALTGGSWDTQPSVRPLTMIPLAAGESFTPADIDLTQAPGVGLISYIVEADTPTQVEVYTGDGTNFRLCGLVVVDAPGNLARVIPPFRPLGTRWRVTLRNPTGTNQTMLRAIELRYSSTEAFPQNLRGLLAKGLEIRDTASHSFVSDPQTVFRLRRIPFGGGVVPIFVDNTHDQAINVNVNIAIAGVLVASLGTVAVPAASRRVITNQDFAGLDVPSEEIQLTFSASVPPTTGSITAYTDTLVGGGGR